ARQGHRVCVIDLDPQAHASIHLGIEAVGETPTVYDVFSGERRFAEVRQLAAKNLWVVPASIDLAAAEIELASLENRELIIRHALLQWAGEEAFDYVIIDMPGTLVQWTETVLSAAQIYFATLELDMRSAQNALRLKRALKSEELPIEKLRFCLNRAPKFTDLNGKSRVKRLAESLEISIEVQLPDGGRPVMQAGDHGTPLAGAAAKNPLRKEIAKLAASLHAIGQSDADQAA
ncbi:MAG: AAA family ATPase, partial [Pseudomonadota bacterium]